MGRPVRTETTPLTTGVTPLTTGASTEPTTGRPVTTETTPLTTGTATQVKRSPTTLPVYPGTHEHTPAVNCVLGMAAQMVCVRT
jgi:hypothetical protein